MEVRKMTVKTMAVERSLSNIRLDSYPSDCRPNRGASTGLPHGPRALHSPHEEPGQLTGWPQGSTGASGPELAACPSRLETQTLSGPAAAG
jgi:hypothetical protein